MKLSVVIVSYNVRHYLFQCLDSVLRATAEMDADVWVVDNCSTDGSVSLLRDHFPDVHFIQNEENVGFARANNQAIRLSQGEYVLLLNPDTIVGEDVLQGCVDFLDKHPEAGATGTMMLNRNGSFAYESRRGVPTPATAFYKFSGLCSLFPYSRRFGKYYMRYLDRNEVSEIEIISGAFFMLRRTALEQVGLLSEEYFMYGEDIDLSYSLLKAGWHNYYQPLPILHYKGESTQKTSFRYVHSFYNAMLIFFDRHFRHRYRLFTLFVHLAVDIKGFFEYVYRQLKHLLQRHSGSEITYYLLYVGNEQSWSAVEAICQRAAIIPQRAKSTEEARELARARTFNYIAFQTGNEGTPYSEILRFLQSIYDNGLDLHLGTFNQTTNILLLPNDICN
ncbi:MAG: glycosyltransferase family 2 protein [Bacteroidaceae bacterium]|nr:glycosyltransferase family 2 protein [Bacteroidaceae bacterium]